VHETPPLVISSPWLRPELAGASFLLLDLVSVATAVDLDIRKADHFPGVGNPEEASETGREMLVAGRSADFLKGTACTTNCPSNLDDFPMVVIPVGRLEPPAAWDDELPSEDESLVSWLLVTVGCWAQGRLRLSPPPSSSSVMTSLSSSSGGETKHKDGSGTVDLSGVEMRLL
jgi:hypothetical protein